MPPILQGWDGDLWGDTGQGKGSPQTPGSGWGSPCTPYSMGSLPFQRGSKPQELSHSRERVWNHSDGTRGNPAWVGEPQTGGSGPFQTSMDTARLRASTPGKGEDSGLIPVVYPQIPALEGLWGARAGGGQEVVTLGGKGTPGRMEVVLGIPEPGKAGGRRGRGRCELAACVHPEVALSE